jgi:hypothetical protein
MDQALAPTGLFDLLAFLAPPSQGNKGFVMEALLVTPPRPSMQKAQLVKRLVGWLGWLWVGRGLGRLGAYLLVKTKMTGWIGDQGMVISSASGYGVVQAAFRQLSRLFSSLFRDRSNSWDILKVRHMSSFRGPSRQYNGCVLLPSKYLDVVN